MRLVAMAFFSRFLLVLGFRFLGLDVSLLTKKLIYLFLSLLAKTLNV
jgi:hypothetical protein